MTGKMPPLLFLGIALNLIGLAAANVIAPVITQPAQLRREESTSSDDYRAWLSYITSYSDFVGFFWYTYTSANNIESSVSYMSCKEGMVFTTMTTFSRAFVDCCSTDELDCTAKIVTGCSSGTVAHYEDGSTTCSDYPYTSCNTDTIYTSNTNDANAMHWVGCNGANQREYYREIPETILALTTKESSSTLSTAPSSTSSRPTTTAESAPSLPTPAPTPQNKASKAWIAGVVVGAAALIAIAGMAFWLLRIRKRNTQQTYQPTPQASQAYTQQPHVESYASPPNAASSMLSTQPTSKGALTPSTQNSQARESFQHDAQTNSWYQPVPSSPPQSTVYTDGTTAAETLPPREMSSVISPATTDLPELVNESQARK